MTPKRRALNLSVIFAHITIKLYFINHSPAWKIETAWRNFVCPGKVFVI